MILSSLAHAAGVSLVTLSFSPPSSAGCVAASGTLLLSLLLGILVQWYNTVRSGDTPTLQDQ